MIDLLKKDIVGEVNPYLFQKIQTKINDRQRGNIPAWSVVTLKYGLAALALLHIRSMAGFGLTGRAQGCGY